MSVVVSVGCGFAYSNLFFFYRLVQISLGMRIVYYNALLHGKLFFFLSINLEKCRTAGPLGSEVFVL